MDENETMETTDFYLSVYLQALNFPCEIRRESNKTCVFVFDKTEEALHEKENYFNGGRVSALAFKDALRNLKSRMSNL